MSGWARRLGLDWPELRAWAMYDWANSAFVTTVITAVFPIYFATVACAGAPAAVATARFAAASTLAMVIVAALSPPFGVAADQAAIKKKLLFACVLLGVVATALLSLVGPGDWVIAATLFGLGNIGLMGSFVFYDALLPHLAADDEVDRVSSAGYALGYLGGGLLLAVNLLWIQRPSWFGLSGAAAASRLSFLSVALWWAGFSIPLFRRVPEPRVTAPAGLRAPALWREAMARLARTGRELRAYPQAFVLLIAFVLYNDGIGTVYRMAAIYGTELGLSQGAMIGALLVTQFVSIPFAFAFGWIAERIGSKRAILLSLVVYLFISGFAYRMRTDLHFFGLALLVAMVQGGAQSLSRSLFATLIPRDRSTQFFSLFGVFDKISGILGPAVFAATARATGSSRYAILSVVLFFVSGGAVLATVDVERGQRDARR